MNKFSAVLKKSGDQYVALCLELGVVGSGSTTGEAKKVLIDAIESYLDYAKEESLNEDRPVSVKELHEFLFYEEIPDPSQLEGNVSLALLQYA